VVLTLRPAGPADLDACARIYVAAAAAAFPWMAPEQRGAAQFHESIAEEALWLAEGPAGVAGLLSIYLPERFVHSLYVDPACWRRGVGRALADLALRECGGYVQLKCQEANRHACGFYIATGWQAADWGWSPSGAWIRYFRRAD
jgi:ribosomal protein S18 acetylase RimI-like enzyme